MKQAVYGIANTAPQANAIVERLVSTGFLSSDISVLFPDKGGARDFAGEKSTKAPEGAIAGGVAGLGMGGALGLLAGIGALTIPGIGPFVAAGPIMAALSGAAVGGAAGGIFGGLVGLGNAGVRGQAKRGQSACRKYSDLHSHGKWRVAHTSQRDS